MPENWGVSGGPTFGLRIVKFGLWTGNGSYSNQIVAPSAQLFGIRLRTSKGELTGNDAITARHARAISGSGNLRIGSISLSVLSLITGGAIESGGSAPNRRKRLRFTGGRDFPYFGLCGKAHSDKGGDLHLFVAKAKISDDFDIAQLEYENFPTPEIPFEAIPDDSLQVDGVTSVQTITLSGSPTGGTFTLTFRGETTTGIAHDANAAAVQSALQALSSIGSGNATVSGSGPYVVTFAGDLAEQAVELLIANGSSLSGGSSPSVSVVMTTPGEDPESVVFDALEHETAESVLLPPYFAA
ncbi:MAG: hypothetical protein KF716_08780 [Anaerolineae bacterium]|nr:hypothetical protein [Anaerolineae bacterium]